MAYLAELRTSLYNASMPGAEHQHIAVEVALPVMRVCSDSIPSDRESHPKRKIRESLIANFRSSSLLVETFAPLITEKGSSSVTRSWS